MIDRNRFSVSTCKSRMRCRSLLTAVSSANTGVGVANAATGRAGGRCQIVCGSGKGRISGYDNWCGSELGVGGCGLDGGEMAEALRASGWWIRCWLRLMAVRSR